ncbi:hypothetical protein D3C83_138100 [compost metagenome]
MHPGSPFAISRVGNYGFVFEGGECLDFVPAFVASDIAEARHAVRIGAGLRDARVSSGHDELNRHPC